MIRERLAKVFQQELILARLFLFAALMLPFHALLAQHGLVTVSPSTISEAEGTATVTVDIPNDLNVPENIFGYSFSFTGSTAEFGNDFTFTENYGDDGRGTSTITGVDDAIVESVEAIEITVRTYIRDFLGTGIPYVISEDTVTVTITDNDVRSVAVSKGSLTIKEGGSATYSVALTSQPTDTVTVSALMSGSGDVSVSPGTLSFTEDNWNVAQEVTVSAGSDADAVNDKATVGHTVSGGDYGANGVTAASVEVEVIEPSTSVALSVSPAEVVEGDGAADVSVSVTGTLDGEARAQDTVVSLLASNYTKGTPTLTIPAGDTSATAPFTLTGTGDDIDEPDEEVEISGSTAVSGMTVTSTELTILDDDDRGVTVSSTELDVTEGGSGSYTVVLDSQPTAPVPITVRSSDPGAATVSPGSLTFGPTNWSTPQTVTVEGVHDEDYSDESVTVGHAAEGASDY